MAALAQINRGTQQQAGATQQTSAALGQIEKSARLAQQNAEQSNGRIAQMGTGLKQNAEAVGKLVSGVATSLDAVRAVLVTIARLEAVGRNIEKIVNAISLVVVQTTMLAVSGAVEAARAGQSGRGFAVVSNDIRALARSAAESADTIKETVAGILAQIASLRRDLDQILESIEAEVQTNRSVLTALDRVDREAAALQTANQAILRGAEQVLHAASDAAAGARQIASAAEEAGAAARQAADRVDRAGAGRRGPRRGDRGDRLAGRGAEAAEWLRASSRCAPTASTTPWPRTSCRR
jgi:methyl-accepting chemotaxis protein